MPVVTRLRHGLGVLATAVCAVVGVLLVLTAPEPERVGTVLRCLGVVALVGVLGALPLVRLDARGVLVRNPWRTWWIGWRALDDVGFGWSLWLRPVGSGRDVRALAAPGPSRMQALYDRHLTEGGVIERDAAITASTSMAPALLAVRQGRERWSRGDEADAGTRSGWSWGGLALTAVGLVCAGVGVLLG